MDSQKKTYEELFFYRQEMRCREVEAGFPGNLASRLYAVVSNYGWSVNRPAIGLLAAGVAGFLWSVVWLSVAGACPAPVGGPEVQGCGWTVAAVSFSNLLGFVGLGRVALGDEIAALDDLWWFEVQAGVQLFAGPVLLFFLFLALRNRYRMR